MSICGSSACLSARVSLPYNEYETIAMVLLGWYLFSFLTNCPTMLNNVFVSFYAAEVCASVAILSIRFHLSFRALWGASLFFTAFSLLESVCLCSCSCLIYFQFNFASFIYFLPCTLMVFLPESQQVSVRASFTCFHLPSTVPSC